MTEKTVIIQNPTGLHARPAAQFVNFVKKYNECNITMKTKDKQTNPKSILGVISLGLSEGSEVTICTEGVDEAQVCDDIVQYLADLKE